MKRRLPLLAQIGHTARWNECLFLREEPTSIRAATKSEWDPKRTIEADKRHRGG